MDNASVNDKMSTLLEKMDFRISEMAEWKFSAHEQRIRCSAHILHLCCTDAFLHFEPLLQRLRTFIKHLKLSPTKAVVFEAICRSCIDCSTNIPILDVVTRWNSTFEMLNRAIQLRQGIDAFTDQKDYLAYKLQECEWNTLIEVREFLEIFNYITQSITTNSPSTLSLIVPYYQRLIHHCCRYITPDNFIRCASLYEAAVAACNKLEKYFDKVNCYPITGRLALPIISLPFWILV